MISDGLPELPNPQDELLDYQKVEDCVRANAGKDAESAGRRRKHHHFPRGHAR